MANERCFKIRATYYSSMRDAFSKVTFMEPKDEPDDVVAEQP